MLLPLGNKGKFASVALSEVAQLAALILTVGDKHGLVDIHRDQLIILTRPAMMAGEKVAKAMSQALGKKMNYDTITE